MNRIIVGRHVKFRDIHTVLIKIYTLNNCGKLKKIEINRNIRYRYLVNNLFPFFRRSCPVFRKH